MRLKISHCLLLLSTVRDSCLWWCRYTCIYSGGCIKVFNYVQHIVLDNGTKYVIGLCIYSAVIVYSVFLVLMKKIMFIMKQHVLCWKLPQMSHIYWVSWLLREATLVDWPTPSLFLLALWCQGQYLMYLSFLLCFSWFHF